MIELPLEKVPPLYTDPRCLLVYSKPKTGKSTVFSHLPKSVILDLEGSTDHIYAVKLTVIGLKPPAETAEQVAARHKTKRYYLTEVIVTLRQHNPYTYGIIETVTKLEEWCIKDATLMYMSSPIGKNYNRYTLEDQIASQGKFIEGTLKPEGQWESVLTLPKGAGYQWLRDSYEKWMGYLKPLFPHLILSGHLKTTYLSGKNKKDGTETETNDIDLLGKVKVITTAFLADAIGYMFRKDSQNFISFKPTDEVLCGSRIPHLEGRDILVSEKGEDGTVKVYWENIFTNLPK